MKFHFRKTLYCALILLPVAYGLHMSVFLTVPPPQYVPGGGATGGMPPVYPFSGDVPFVQGGGQGQQGLGLHGEHMIMDTGDGLRQAQVAVPDHMVGVILGKGGATVVEIQNLTGA
ncbi:unnamed protein product, partial [Choristocarpus tenellus]